MNRRETTIALLVLAGSAPAIPAQAPAKVPRIGVLGVDLESAPRSVGAFAQRLQELGYVDGRNVAVVYRSAQGNPDRLAGLAVELAAMPVDVIVATGGVPAANAARGATSVIPIVFIGVGNPVGAGYVETLARPGRNLTGLSSVFPDMVQKPIELVRAAMPHAKRVALLVDTNLPSPAASVEKAQATAQALQLQLHEVPVRSPEDFETAFAQMAKARTDAVLVFGSPMILAQRKRLADIALKHRIAVVALLREYTDAGGLMSYGPDLASMFATAANYADKILKGSKPGELPVQQPTKIDLVLNSKTAAALGIKFPRAMLQRAVE